MLAKGGDGRVGLERDALEAAGVWGYVQVLVWHEEEVALTGGAEAAETGELDAAVIPEVF